MLLYNWKYLEMSDMYQKSIQEMLFWIHVQLIHGLITEVFELQKLKPFKT